MVIGLAMAAIAAQAALPPGSFVRRPVKSVSDLVAHVKADPVVMGRYSRHFRLKPAQVVTYFRSLHAAKLANEGVYLVFNVHADNVLRGRYFKLRKGTLVFADSTGRAILKKDCGNAMVMHLPPLVADASTTTPAAPHQPEVADASPTEELTLLTPGVTPAPAAPLAPAMPRHATSGSIGGAGGGWGLGLLPLFFACGSSGFLINKEDEDTPPVPEPATLVVLGAGAAFTAFKRRKRR